MPNSVITTTSFFERVGAVSEEGKVSVDGSLLQVARSVMVDLARGKTVATKAVYIPVSLVVALEDYVVDTSTLPYHRVFAWVRLLQL